ncbi:MAG: signal recognition particle receptor subunit alpha, partial [Atribacterota bacterium]
MFKFLKKRLKKFEDKLESELEAELKKEQEKTKEVTSKELEEKVEKEKTIEKLKQEKLADEKEKQEERRKRLRSQRKKREEELNKQMKKNIESELEHTLQTRKNIQDVVKKERKPTKVISDEKLDELLWDLEVGLLESDVAYSVVESIKNDVREELKNISFERGKIKEGIEEVLKNAISHVLSSSNIDFDDLIKKGKKPIVIMFIGVNGSGKTLSIAKIATMLKKKGYSSV